MTSDDGPVKINRVVRTRSRRARTTGARRQQSSSIPSEGSGSLMDRLRDSTRRQKLIALAVVLLVLLGTFTTIQLYARSMVGQAEVTVEKLRLVGLQDQYLLFEARCLVQNPSSWSARLDGSQLEVHYQDTRVGDIWVPELELDPGTNRFTVKFRFRESDPGAYQRLTADLLLQGQVQVVLKGTITVHNLIGLDLPLDKTVTVSGLSL